MILWLVKVNKLTFSYHLTEKKMFTQYHDCSKASLMPPLQTKAWNLNLPCGELLFVFQALVVSSEYANRAIYWHAFLFIVAPLQYSSRWTAWGLYHAANRPHQSKPLNKKRGTWIGTHTFNTSSCVCLVYPECSGLYGSRGGASEGLHTDRAGRGGVLCAAEGSGHFL